jgi:transcriptional regulator with XRE-family HTH domain
VFATKLKELRIGDNLTQADLADKLNLKPSIIGMYENDKRMPEIKTLKLISEIFNVSTDYLLDKTNIKEHFIPQNLKHLRGTCSIEEYSKTLNISKDLLTRYEEGKEIPTESIIEYIAEIEGINSKYFFKISNNLEALRVESKLDHKELYSNDIKEWINREDSKEYIEFIYKVYKQGFTKEMLDKAEIKIRIT